MWWLLILAVIIIAVITGYIASEIDDFNDGDKWGF